MSAEPVYADQLICGVRPCCDGGVNPGSLSGKVRVESTEYDPSVLVGPSQVKLEEVATIVRQQNASSADCEGEDLRVRYSGVGVSGFQRREDIMAQAAQFDYDLERDVFIGIETGH